MWLYSLRPPGYRIVGLFFFWFGDQLDRLALFGSQSFVSSLTFCTVLI